MFTIKDALLLYIWLRQKESLWVRYRYSIEIDSSSSSKTEPYPVLLLDVSIVKWQFHCVNCLIMPWGVNGESSLQLHVLDLTIFVLDGLDTSRSINHILKVTNLVKFDCLNSAHPVVCDEAIGGHLYTVALSLSVVHVADYCIGRLVFYMEIETL
jgi:hypothetical protein